jgi:hypothetical protein
MQHCRVPVRAHPRNRGEILANLQSASLLPTERASSPSNPGEAKPATALFFCRPRSATNWVKATDEPKEALRERL